MVLLLEGVEGTLERRLTRSNVRDAGAQRQKRAETRTYILLLEIRPAHATRREGEPTLLLFGTKKPDKEPRTMSDPSIGAVATSAPPIMSEEPISTDPAGNETLVCVDASSGSAEGTVEPGARALVERFGGSQGASSTGTVSEWPEGDGPSCSDEALRAIGTCGAAALVATSTGGFAALFAGIACAGAVDGYIECTENQDRAARGRP